MDHVFENVNMYNHDLQSCRAVFISDLHLGFRLSNASACLELLNQIQPERLYLVGDTIDGWRLMHRWFFPSEHQEIIKRLSQMQMAGCEVILLPGNHDDFLRHPDFMNRQRSKEHEPIFSEMGEQLKKFKWAEDTIHVTQSGKRLLIVHGDLFDNVEQRTKGLSVWGSRVFDRILWVLPTKLCHHIRRFFKSVMARPRSIHKRLKEESLRRECDGFVYGHIHRPCMEQEESVLSINLGDWVENESFLVERPGGSLELINFGKGISTVDPGFSDLEPQPAKDYSPRPGKTA